MIRTAVHANHDLIFGAARHDPAFWSAHPLVAEVETHFDGGNGWVGLSLRTANQAPVTPNLRAHFVRPERTREAPDLYFFGEGDCPVARFEHVLGVAELRIAVEGPVEDDSRKCWSAGLWLASPPEPT